MFLFFLLWLQFPNIQLTIARRTKRGTRYGTTPVACHSSHDSSSAHRLQRKEPHFSSSIAANHEASPKCKRIPAAPSSLRSPLVRLKHSQKAINVLHRRSLQGRGRQEKKKPAEREELGHLQPGFVHPKLAPRSSHLIEQRHKGGKGKEARNAALAPSTQAHNRDARAPLRCPRQNPASSQQRTSSAHRTEENKRTKTGPRLLCSNSLTTKNGIEHVLQELRIASQLQSTLNTREERKSKLL